VGGRLVQAALLAQQVAEIVVAAAQVGIERQRLTILLHRLADFSRLLQLACNREQRRRVALLGGGASLFAVHGVGSAENGINKEDRSGWLIVG
jgi:hypothetical protein